MSQQNNQQDNKANGLEIKKLVIVGALAIALAVIVSFFILSALKPKNDDKPEAQKPETKKEEPAKQDIPAAKELTIKDVTDALALTLFNQGLDNASIKDTTQEDVAGKTELHFVIDRGHADMETLKSAIAEGLSQIGMETAVDEHVTAVTDKLNVVIDVTEKKAPPKKTVKSDMPAGDYAGVKVALVIDDCGYSIPLAEKLTAVKYPLALAIIPYTPHGKETADIIRKNRQTVFLHQPMQPQAYPNVDPGKGAILLNMPESLIGISLRNNVEDIGGKIDGFNNHMGSALTESVEKMDQVFAVMKDYTDFYVDSYTSAASVAYDECLKNGMTCAQNRKFIDNESDPEYIKSKIMEGLKLGKEKGSIIMIGHLRDNTVDVLVDFLPQIEAMGAKIVPVRELASK